MSIIPNTVSSLLGCEGVSFWTTPWENTLVSIQIGIVNHNKTINTPFLGFDIKVDYFVNIRHLVAAQS